MAVIMLFDHTQVALCKLSCETQRVIMELLPKLLKPPDGKRQNSQKLKVKM